MSTTLKFENDITCRLLILDDSGQAWNTSGTPALEAWDDDNFDDYLITPTQLGTSSFWLFTVPATLPAGQYTAHVYDGAAPIVTDAPIGDGEFAWDGSGLVTGHEIASGATVIRADNADGDKTATAANQTTILNRIGAWTGSGDNTILGAFKALLSKTASAPSDIGGTFDPATDSVEAIRDRGDAAWDTGEADDVPTVDEIVAGIEAAGIEITPTAAFTTTANSFTITATRGDEYTTDSPLGALLQVPLSNADFGDLTSATVKFTAKHATDDKTIIAVTDGTITDPNTTDQKAVIQIEASDWEETSADGPHVADLEVSIDGAKVTTVHGTMTVIDDQTK